MGINIWCSVNLVDKTLGWYTSPTTIYLRAPHSLAAHNKRCVPAQVHMLIADHIHCGVGKSVGVHLGSLTYVNSFQF